MKPLFLCYAKCGTCTKASKWLKANAIEVESRDITVENPTLEELTLWVEQSGLPISKFFNTSGVKYRELGVKDIIKTASKEELIKLLASDGKLVKRPILVKENSVLVGFKEENYVSLFNV
ncbi:MAG: arsenate reductase family protein [Rikenellaceae bacterium]